jgi:hypothetical protein
LVHDEGLNVEGGGCGGDLLAASLLLAVPEVAADGLFLNGRDVIIVEDLRAVFLLSHFLHKLEVALEALAL